MDHHKHSFRRVKPIGSASLYRDVDARELAREEANPTWRDMPATALNTAARLGGEKSARGGHAGFDAVPDHR